MINQIQRYDWGHPSFIRELIDPVPLPQSGPQAEMWLGAHPLAASKIEIHSSLVGLDELIRLNPDLWLGHEALESDLPTLPFLLKVLAAAKPLSIQCHPSLDKARQGFRREESSGLPLQAPGRNYKDQNHKPELLWAMRDFTALAGFRDIEAATDDLRELASQLDASTDRQLVESLIHQVQGGDWSAATTLVLGLGPGHRLTDKLVEFAAKSLAQHLAWLYRASQFFPGDPGLWFFVLLQFWALKPGQALSLPTGVLHAYLDGCGVEIMANSDNVLRGGLTTKHIDIPELLANIDQRAKVALAHPEPMANGGRRYRLSSCTIFLDYFHLAPGQRVQVQGTGEPEIWLTVDGQVSLQNPANLPLELRRGESIFARPHGDQVALTGSGMVFRASMDRIEP